MSMLPTDVVLSEHRGWTIGWRHVKARALQALSRRAMTVFLRPGDVISADPIVGGVHEQHIADFFVAASRAGYADFFFDIGANIGLSSCPAVDRFNRIYAFEPNPLAFSILAVNAECTGRIDKFELNNFGIGDRDEMMQLVIPKHNWGGAFISDAANIYSSDTLTKKDNLKSFQEQNYIRREVVIREGGAVFAERFERIVAAGGKAGVIKIDVEGFELNVLAEIARAFPPELEAYVILENWEPSVSVSQFTKMFGTRARPFSFDAERITSRTAPRAWKALRFLAGLPFGWSDFRYRLRTIADLEKPLMGDLVLHLSADS